MGQCLAYPRLHALPICTLAHATKRACVQGIQKHACVQGIQKHRRTHERTALSCAYLSYFKHVLCCLFYDTPQEREERDTPGGNGSSQEVADAEVRAEDLSVPADMCSALNLKAAEFNQV